MRDESQSAFWRVLQPANWPEPPAWMSYSTLANLEACPRRWALGAATYSEIAAGHGYPRPLHFGTLEGTTLHLSLQTLTSALAKKSCPSLSHESAISTLKELGGFTAVVLDGLDHALESFRNNPRATPVLDDFRVRLTTRVPELRSKLQRYLARIRPLASPGGADRVNRETIEHARPPLSQGSYAEIGLRSLEMRWRGIADLLTISDTFCEIRDFKTGMPKQDHVDQLHTYALLWTLDHDLNPIGRLPDRLVISYEDGDKEISVPTERDLRQLKDELEKRTSKAISDLRVTPPQARPSSQNCVYCPYRHLCNEYWEWYAAERPFDHPTPSGFGDVQIRMTAQHGPRSWNAVVEYGPLLRNGSPILLRTESETFRLLIGERGRLLNVRINRPDEEQLGEPLSDSTTVISVGTTSEIFLIEN